MRRFKQVFFFLTILVVLSAVFQNCGAPMEPSTGSLYGRDELPSCLGPSCGVDLELVQLQIGNADPIQLTKAASTSTCDSTNCFDLAGYCDDGGFPGSVIYLKIMMGQQTVVSEKRTTAVCDENGRFRLQVQMPAGHNQDAFYTARLILRVIDEDGQIFDNPGGLHQKDINITSVVP